MPGTEERLKELELELLNPEVRNAEASVAALLADEFREFGSSGRVFNRSQMIEALRNEPPRQIAIHDFEVRMLTPEVALATYQAVRADGSASLRSSVWVVRQGRWQMTFHQGTRASSTQTA